MLFLVLLLVTHLTDPSGAACTEALDLLNNLMGIGCQAVRLAGLLRRPGHREDHGVVEPGMTFTTPGVASALIGRYRPTGVPRLGSSEDRAEAYRRLLDASARSFAYLYQVANLRHGAGRAADKFLLEQLPQAWEISSELIGALQGVRLCGSVPVIAAAEHLVEATGELDLNEKSAERFQHQAEAVVSARDVFLDACRGDLAYTTRWWQLRRRLNERRFQRAQRDTLPRGGTGTGR